MRKCGLARGRAAAARTYARLAGAVERLPRALATRCSGRKVVGDAPLRSANIVDAGAAPLWISQPHNCVTAMTNYAAVL